MSFFSCSQCSFTAQFESALMMHHQLHHESSPVTTDLKTSSFVKENPKPLNRSPAFCQDSKEKFFKLPGRTSSATKIFDKIKARICRSKHVLVSHAEEDPSPVPELNINLLDNDMSCPISPSECTSKALKAESSAPRCIPVTRLETPGRENNSYVCHLCSYVADRITVLDRHLLNDHKIGLDNLLRLVLAKTKDGLDSPLEFEMFPTTSYYKPLDGLIEDSEFVYETASPKIKILRHASTNTDLRWTDIAVKGDCRVIPTELESLVTYTPESQENDFLEKMKTLNECMCKFVDSSNTLKKALTMKYESKAAKNEPLFDLALGDTSPRDWERAKSEMMDRRRKYSDEYGTAVPRLLSKTYYF